MVYDLFLSCGNSYHSLQIVQGTTKSVLFEALLVSARKTSNTKLQEVKYSSTQISKITIIIIASHCGRGCNCHVQRNILVQEPSLNSTVLLRYYGLKTRMKVFESGTIIFTTETWQNIFCPTLITKIVNISGSTQPFFTKQEPLDSQLDNKSFHYIIEMFSTTFRNTPESLI